MKLGGEAMTPYLPRLLEMSLNNATIPSNRKKTQWFPLKKVVIDGLARNIDP